MSFGGRTPESLLPRSDSKNPATTCKGITANGRPCRRALAASLKSSPAPSPGRANGVVAVLDLYNAGAFFCWQHQNQAEHLAAQRDQRTTLYPLKERSSIDTLIDRVGVLNLEDDVSRTKRKRQRRKGNDQHLSTNRDKMPSGWHDMKSPIMTVPNDLLRPTPPRRPEHSSGRSNVRASWSCCIRADDDDLPPPRKQYDRQRPHASTTVYRPGQGSTQPPMLRQPAPQARPQMSQRTNQSPQTFSTAQVTTPTRPNPRTKSKSQTQTLLSLIPSHLSPQTASQLLAELSRPISSFDEAGYIYIYWLTPDSELSAPDDETASSLLDDEDEPNTSSTHNQRTADTLHRYASVRNSALVPRTITLKIGRAANVHRRLSQWSKQCGQNISLIRYYPYSTATSNSNKPQPPQSLSAHKVPHVHRVERLIHIELAEKRVAKPECAQCGREHREWFEIAASRKGLRAVDEVVRRWVAWAESAKAEDSGVGTGTGRAEGQMRTGDGVFDGVYA